MRKLLYYIVTSLLFAALVYGPFLVGMPFVYGK